jgi:pyruvate,water dikinase
MATSLTAMTVFPVDWNVAADGAGPFSYDPMHFPFPISPLTASAQAAFSVGHAAAARELDIPELGFDIRVINHYRFERFVPLIPASEAEAAAGAARAEETMRREIGRLIDRWYMEHLPRLRALEQRLRAMRPRGQDAATVLALLDEADTVHREAWTIHFRIAFPMLTAMQLFTEFHTDLFGADADAPHALMAGNVTESMKAAFGLADLAQRARELGLADVVMGTPAADLMTALEGTDAGQAFLAELDAYLEAYGLRQELLDLAAPTWREDPAVALATIRSYLDRGHDPRAEHARIAQAAETAFEAARTRLASYPGAVWAQYEQMVQNARQGAFLQEEHNFYIDQRMLASLRYFYLEIGAHLRELGLLDEAAEVFMLRLDEIRELLDQEQPGADAEKTRALVVARRIELEQAAALTPPGMIGEPPGEAPPDSLRTRTMAAFFGGPPQAAERPGQLKGHPGSRGVASGLARVARTLEDASAMQPGEVLVAITTMPAWTPLFGIAAAVVTETGGQLSHCAVVAREYGIPAVVGARGATRVIQTGQRVSVDGSAGIVIIDD